MPSRWSAWQTFSEVRGSWHELTSDHGGGEQPRLAADNSLEDGPQSALPH
jgi:hypothetical protein